jgi:hypothetical protein
MTYDEFKKHLEKYLSEIKGEFPSSYADILNHASVLANYKLEPSKQNISLVTRALVSLSMEFTWEFLAGVREISPTSPTLINQFNIGTNWIKINSITDHAGHPIPMNQYTLRDNVLQIENYEKIYLHGYFISTNLDNFPAWFIDMMIYRTAVLVCLIYNNNEKLANYFEIRIKDLFDHSKNYDAEFKITTKGLAFER